MIASSTTEEVAEHVASLIGQFSHGYSAQEITVGVPEPEILAPLVERLDRSGVETRLAAGVAVPQTAPIRLLRLAGEFIHSGRYEDFAALIRLPKVERLIRRTSDIPDNFIALLDKYYQETLISSVRVAELPNAGEAKVFETVLRIVDQWLQPLRMEKAELQTWAQAFRTVIGTIVVDDEVNLDDTRGSTEYQAVALLSKVLAQIEDLPSDKALLITLGEALGWIARDLEKRTDSAIE